MLILSRREGETIYINDDIQITILYIKDGQARIGITAPKEFAVHREEVYWRIQGEKASAQPKDAPI